MNRTLLSLFALASILFLFGSLVVAESGSGTAVDAVSEKEAKELLEKEMKAKIAKAKLTTALKIKEMKKFEVEDAAEMEARKIRAAAERKEVELKIKRVNALPAWVTSDVKEMLSAFDLDEATLKKIESLSSSDREAALKELRIRYELKNNGEEKSEIRIRMEKIEDRAREVAEAHQLEGAARYLARLEVAIKMATENGNTELVEKLTALKTRLAEKKELSESEADEVEDSIFENRNKDFAEKAPKAISLAQRVDSRLTDFITRLENLISEQETAGLNTARLDAGIGKLTKVEARLSEQIAITQEDWDAYVANPSRDTLKAVHFDLVKLKVLARHALHDMKVMVRFYKHFSENKGVDDGSFDDYDDSLIDESELETEVEVEAVDEAQSVVGAVDVTLVDESQTADDNPSADDVAGETDDSGVDGDDDGVNDDDGDDNGGDDE